MGGDAQRRNNMEAVTMTTLLETIATIITAILTQVAAVASTITTVPLLALSLGFFFLGGVCGIISRMLSRS